MLNRYYGPDQITYQVNWLKCARDYHGIIVDFLGLWNGKPNIMSRYGRVVCRHVCGARPPPGPRARCCVLGRNLIRQGRKSSCAPRYDGAHLELLMRSWALSVLGRQPRNVARARRSYFSRRLHSLSFSSWSRSSSRLSVGCVWKVGHCTASRWSERGTRDAWEVTHGPPRVGCRAELGMH